MSSSTALAPLQAILHDCSSLAMRRPFLESPESDLAPSHSQFIRGVFQNASQAVYAHRLLIMFPQLAGSAAWDGSKISISLTGRAGLCAPGASLRYKIACCAFAKFGKR